MRLLTGISSVLFLLVAGGIVSAADKEAPRVFEAQGTISKVDAARGILTVRGGGEDHELAVTKESKFFDGSLDRPIADGLKDKRFKAGVPVRVRVSPAPRKNGRPVLVAALLNPPRRDFAAPKLSPADLAALKPLPELGSKEYKGFAGGLYPDGKNERPPAHEAAGLQRARKVQPLDTDGKPSARGKIVLLSIGMSNTTQEFSVFKRLADADEAKNPRLVIVDGAQGGMTAFRIQSLEERAGMQFWKTVDERLKAAGVSRAQVQVAWIKEADAVPREPFPRHAQKLQAELGRIVRLMHERFPNLKLVYLSSRIYAGHARTPLNPEPFAFDGGFAVKWLIEQQIKGEPSLNYDAGKGPVKAPWLSWGPYLWADGKTYKQEDFGGDGTHPSLSGRKKVAEQLLRFFKTDSTAKVWFLGSKKGAE
jgi:hypothetical protein